MHPSGPSLGGSPAPAPAPRCHPGVYAMRATRNRPLNSRTSAPASVLEGLRAERPRPRVAPTPAPRETLFSPQARLTCVRPPGARHGQDLRQRQEEDQQAGFPEPHRGGVSAGSQHRQQLSDPGPGALAWRAEREGRKEAAPSPPTKPSPEIGWGSEPANPSPIRGAGRGRLAARPSSGHRPPRPRSSPASSARREAAAFKARSPNVRCPLLIGCAGATNQQLPLGLPGAHRLREGAGENKGGRQEPEGRGRTTHRGTIGRRGGGRGLCVQGGAELREALLCFAGRTRVLRRAVSAKAVCSTCSGPRRPGICSAEGSEPVC